MHISESQLKLVNEQVQRLVASGNYFGRRLREAGVTEVLTEEDFYALPFSEKEDLRNCYPLGVAAVDERQIVRIHSSSGTTGTPVIIPYTARDLDDWAEQFRRCYELAGITADDRIQITPGYGLWTAGIGFQAGAEKLGAMPMTNATRADTAMSVMTKVTLSASPTFSSTRARRASVTVVLRPETVISICAPIYPGTVRMLFVPNRSADITCAIEAAERAVHRNERGAHRRMR